MQVCQQQMETDSLACDALYSSIVVTQLPAALAGAPNTPQHKLARDELYNDMARLKGAQDSQAVSHGHHNDAAAGSSTDLMPGMRLGSLGQACGLQRH
jgi:hypothetical protein